MKGKKTSKKRTRWNEESTITRESKKSEYCTCGGGEVQTAKSIKPEWNTGRRAHKGIGEKRLE